MDGATEKVVDYDVIIVGSGISGINSAYRVQTQVPNATYTILEARGGLGGTWDFFKYPGIRSDSDLHTFGFSWRPWTERRAIADGPSIVRYLKESAEEYGIDKKIQYNHKVISVDWSSDTLNWSLEVQHNGETKTMRGRFLILGTGYYNYDEPMESKIPGLERFKGTTVHPQFWPEDLDYSNKKMVIIGSGATAVTLLPVVAKTASHVTMLQRSPSYVLSLPNGDPLGEFYHRFLPLSWAHKLDRYRFLVFGFLFYHFCRFFPNAARGVLAKATKKQLPSSVLFDPHFVPTYNPWDQRLCLCPDGDFYEAMRSGKADVVTGHIKTVTEKGILLESGETITADIICTATGLKLKIAGGMTFTVDGQKLHVPDKFLWKGIMLQDLPNAAFVLGYTNASWTLGADATAQLVTRLMNHMRKNGFAAAVPRVQNPDGMKSQPVLNLKSTYLQNAASFMPKAGSVGQWRPRSNYFRDMHEAKRGDITTGLEFYKDHVANGVKC